MRAHGHYVIFKMVESKMTDTKLEILEDKHDPIARGKVISVGEEVDTEIVEGSTIIFHNRRDQDFHIGGTRHWFIEDKYILAVIPNEQDGEETPADGES